jgi:hypothetical protein
LAVLLVVVGKSLVVGLSQHEVGQHEVVVLLSEVEVEDVVAAQVLFPNALQLVVQVLFPGAGALAAEGVEEDVDEDVAEAEKIDEVLNQKQLNN